MKNIIALLTIVLLTSCSANSNDYDPEIYKAQQALSELGYSVGTANGIYERKTKDALKRYQRDHNLPTTGRLDANTRALLFKPSRSSLEQSQAASQRAQVLRLKENGDILSSYTGSYALLIGESDYTNGWQDLESIPGELQQVENLLTSHGFQVEKAFNLNARQLRNRFETFINQYGFEENNRLLFFFSGHGYTRKNKGYIVPIDAPAYDLDKKGFLQKALTMTEILAMARRIEAKHALFLFDSCFSGTVFKAKSKIPRQISNAAALPVRQFITAGSADQTVPAKSVFTPAFVDALRFGLGDLNKDGYVTGQELGLYLWNKVPQHNSRQTPQYGKIKDYDLSRGDFVFAVDSQVSSKTQMTPLEIEIKYVYRRKDKDEFLSLSNGQVLYAGDYYKIIFTPTEKTYVYIFQKGSSGNIYRLFPIKSFKGVNHFNPTQAGITYHIPAEDKSFFLDEQAGEEKIYFIAARQPDTELENQYQQVLKARGEQQNAKIQQARLEGTIRYRDPAGIGSDNTENKVFTWTEENGQQFSMLRQRLEICEGCVNVLSFLHR